MAEKTSTQRSGSNRGNDRGNGGNGGNSGKNQGSYSYNESAVHKPVPGKGGKNK